MDSDAVGNRGVPGNDCCSGGGCRGTKKKRTALGGCETVSVRWCHTHGTEIVIGDVDVG